MNERKDISEQNTKLKRAKYKVEKNTIIEIKIHQMRSIAEWR